MQFQCFVGIICKFPLAFNDPRGVRRLPIRPPPPLITPLGRRRRFRGVHLTTVIANGRDGRSEVQHGRVACLIMKRVQKLVCSRERES
jgi:hypothetical protein